MSTRQESLKRQYAARVTPGGAPAPRGCDGNGRPVPRVRRHWFWRWFWLIFLLTLLGGFLNGRKQLAAWYADHFERDGTVTAVGRILGTPQLRQGSQEKNAHQGALPSGDVVDDAVVLSYLTPSEAEVVQLYNYVLNAPFVVENLQYRDRLKDLPFIYQPADDTVNAAAGRRIVEKDGQKGLAFQTVFYGGAARYARLVGLAAALQDAGHADMLKKFVAAMPRSFCGRCNAQECARFIAANGLADAFKDEQVRNRAISYSSGTIVSVLAHECGHHALGHLLAFPEKPNPEINRNQEREADSFASSVISASPFGEFIFAGTLFWHYAVAMQSDSDSDAERDHPLSRERFENFVRANAEKAAAMGITLN